ncbi:MAG: CBS domain-containing protein [Candidatus Verstraetearchaeota archaeon]|nr:CBS domain-containing protein [Candidatus Verstraetearchaeota archaeon]
MRLTEIATKDVPVLNKNRPLLDALEVMEKDGLESICVSDDGKIVGSISNTDILAKIGTQRLRAVSPGSLYISGFMSEFPVTLSDDTPIRRAAKFMLELDAGLLPMFYGETFLGVVYRINMARAVHDRTEEVSQLMRKKFPSVKSNDRAIHARKMILESRTSVLPVLNEDGRYLGAVTRGSLLKALIDFHMYVPEKHQKARIRQLQISNVMKADYPSIGGDARLCDAARKILEERALGIVVVEGMSPIGLLTIDEILNFIISTFPEEQ